MRSRTESGRTSRPIFFPPVESKHIGSWCAILFLKFVLLRTTMMKRPHNLGFCGISVTISPVYPQIMAICGQIAVRVHNIAQIVATNPFRSTKSPGTIIDKTQLNRCPEPQPKNRHFFGRFQRNGRNINVFSAKLWISSTLAENMPISRPEWSGRPRICRSTLFC